VVLAYQRNSNLDTNNQSPEYLLEEEKFKLKLQNAISSLTEAQREVFLMNRIDGKKYREIADL
jgi:RNA polymerase sigma-70 factor (ECF subfamily)